MRTSLMAAILITVACTQPTPEAAPSANAVASNTLAEMDNAIVSSPTGPIGENVAADPDSPVASAPAPPVDGAARNMTKVPDIQEDSCGASKLQHLVGKPRSAIPSGLPPRTRVTCTNCPVTMDYSPERLNIFYDEKSGVIQEVRCG